MFHTAELELEMDDFELFFFKWTTITCIIFVCCWCIVQVGHVTYITHFAEIVRLLTLIRHANEREEHGRIVQEYTEFENMGWVGVKGGKGEEE